MPSIRSLVRVGTAIAALAVVGLAAAQSPNAGSGLGLGTRLGIRFATSLLVYLLLGGALVALGPRYARETVTELRDDPGGAFVWGSLVGIGVPIVLVLVALTIVGLIVAVPGLIALAVVGVVGNAVTVVWFGHSLTDGDSLDGKTVLVGALVFAVPASIPALGNLLTTLLGFFGLGVVGRRLYESWRE